MYVIKYRLERVKRVKQRTWYGFSNITRNYTILRDFVPIFEKRPPYFRLTFKVLSVLKRAPALHFQAFLACSKLRSLRLWSPLHRCFTSENNNESVVSETMEWYSESHLLSLASTVGERTETGLYVKDVQCEAALQDMIRFLRKDDSPERKVFLQLTAWNILRKDVIPLLLVSHTDLELSMLAVKLLVFLTLPPEWQCENYLEQVRALHSNLLSIIEHSEILSIALLFVSNALEKLEEGRVLETDYEAKMIQLVLTLFRNILLISELSSKVVQNSQDLQVQVRTILSEHSFMDCLSIIVQDVCQIPFKNDLSILVEVFDLLLCKSNPDEVLVTSTGVRQTELKDQKTDFKGQNSIFKMTKLKAARFCGTYAKSSEVANSKILVRGAPKVVNVELCTREAQAFAHSSAVKVEGWIVFFLQNIQSAVINNFLLRSWENVKRKKYDHGVSSEYASELVSFTRVTSFFVGLLNITLQRNSESDLQFLGYKEHFPIANVFCPEFLSWLQKEWGHLEEQKLLCECEVVVRLLERIAHGIKIMKTQVDAEHIHLVCETMHTSLLNGDGHTNFQRAIQTRLKRFKHQIMPSSYLSSLFLLLGRVVDLEENKFVNSFVELLADEIIVENFLWSIHKDPCLCKDEREVQILLLCFVHQTVSHERVFGIHLLLMLQKLINDAVHEVSSASRNLLINAFSSSSQFDKGSYFVRLLTSA